MTRAVNDRAAIVPRLAEVFREHGFEGASLTLISERTSLGKGSLYHFFPGGKDEMGQAVLAEIDTWFETRIFRPLRAPADPRRAVADMFAAVDEYFRSGRRVCLVGLFALSDTRDRFAARVQSYFAEWTTALAAALTRLPMDADQAHALAEETVAAIQGGLVLARAVDDPAVFTRMLARLRERLGTS